MATLLFVGCGGGDAECGLEVPCADPVRSFCDLGEHGSPPGTCIAPPSADACNEAEPCTLAARPHCNPDGVCVECLESAHCPTAGAPFCPAGGGTCFSCEPGAAGDSFCVELDPGRPLCAAGAGCVECLDATVCSAAAPVCDPVAGACRACRAHLECDSELCEIGAGTCVDEDAIIHVAPALAGENSPTCGTRTAPCATIQQGDDSALAKLTADRRFLYLAPGNYPEALELGDLTVTVVAPFGDAILNPNLAAQQPAIEIRGAAQVTLDGLTIAPSAGSTNSHGIATRIDVNRSPTLILRHATIRNTTGIGLHAIQSATVTVENSTIRDSTDLGIHAHNATFTLEASHVLGNLGGGVLLQSTSFVLQNNVIAENGNVLESFIGGLRIENSGTFASQVLQFNTVARNAALDSLADSAGVRCGTTQPMTASSNIIHGNLGPAAQVAGNCAHTFSNIQGGAAGEGNLDADPMFVNPVEGDYHLQAGSPCIDAADPAATVTTDIDGDPRPQGDGFDIGADEFVAE